MSHHFSTIEVYRRKSLALAECTACHARIMVDLDEEGRPDWPGCPEGCCAPRITEMECAADALVSAGFTQEGDWYERTISNDVVTVERVLIEWEPKAKEGFFMLERNGDEVLRGTSGQFSKLLEAVGIEAKK